MLSVTTSHHDQHRYLIDTVGPLQSYRVACSCGVELGIHRRITGGFAAFSAHLDENATTGDTSDMTTDQALTTVYRRFPGAEVRIVWEDLFRPPQWVVQVFARGDWSGKAENADLSAAILDAANSVVSQMSIRA